ncbi:MAG: cache domain-containing protein, partial [Dehalococcoidia bacterium]|nr:cache domain-containing protein [Dehalococcoidia bacterium]
MKEEAASRSSPRRSWNVGLRVRYMALVSSLVIFAVVSVSAVGIILVMGAAKGRVTDTHRETLDRAAFVVDDYFSHHFESMATLASVLYLTELSPQSRWLQLERLLADHEEIEEASVLDAGGQETIRVSRIGIFSQSDLTSRSGEEFFRKSMAGDPFMSQPGHSSRGLSMVGLSVPIKLSPRSNSGVLTVELRLSFLSDWVGQVRLGDTGRLYLVDQAGQVIAHPDPSVALRHENVSDRWPVAQALQGASVLAVSSPDSRYVNEAGKQVLASARSLNSSHLVVVLEQEEDEAMAPLRQALWTSIPLSMFLLAVALGLGFWFTGRLVRPISVLRRASEELERGNLASRADVASGDELEQLAGAFNRMASTIS